MRILKLNLERVITQLSIKVKNLVKEEINSYFKKRILHRYFLILMKSQIHWIIEINKLQKSKRKNKIYKHQKNLKDLKKVKILHL